LTEALQCLHMLMIRCARITALLMYRNAGENRGDCCYGNQYSNGISCVTCMAGANCSTIGTSLATQSLVKGYWRASITSTDVRQCWFPEACTSSSNTSAAAADVPSDCTTTILPDSFTSSGTTSILISDSVGCNDTDTAASISAFTLQIEDTTYCTQGYKGPCKCTRHYTTLYNTMP
jgi:hypothetical protein